jgi:hypothetical protein
MICCCFCSPTCILCSSGGLPRPFLHGGSRQRRRQRFNGERAGAAAPQYPRCLAWRIRAPASHAQGQRQEGHVLLLMMISCSLLVNCDVLYHELRTYHCTVCFISELTVDEHIACSFSCTNEHNTNHTCIHTNHTLQYLQLS